MSVLIAWLAVTIVSLAVERLAARSDTPGPSLAAMPARALLALILLAFWLGIVWRPGLAAMAAALTITAVSAVSAQKRRLVAEPLSFSDFALLRLVVRHPDLYYTEVLTERRTIAAGLALAGLLALWIWLEPPLAGLTWTSALALEASVALSVVGAWSAAPHPRFARWLAHLLPRPDPERHIGRWGLILMLVAYALRWRGEGRQAPEASPPADELPELGPLHPDLVIVVQIESFLDPRRLGLDGPPLPGLERARARALAHGALATPADGAYTMRSEYAVLTGLSPDELGFRRFDPYLSTRHPADTLAAGLRGRGFATLFMHPFRAGFFDRESVMPRLGFERFLWEDDFAGAERVGPYVGDRAFAAHILLEAERRSGAPTLIVAITMENHGPWSDGRLPDATGALPQYLAHLVNGDRAIDDLVSGLDSWPGRALLCLYGDHPPILPALDRPGPALTDYVVLDLGQQARPHAPIRRDMTADALGRLLRKLSAGSPSGGLPATPDRPPPA